MSIIHFTYRNAQCHIHKCTRVRTLMHNFIHINVQCHMSIIHFTYGGVLPFSWIYAPWWCKTLMYESCHTCMSHVTHEWVISRMYEPCPTGMSHITHGWVLPHMHASWGVHDTNVCRHTYINTPCHRSTSHVTYEGGISHMYESCHIRMNHITHVWVMSHTDESGYTMSHITQLCHIWMPHMHNSWGFKTLICIDTQHWSAPCHIRMSHVTYDCIVSTS